MELKVRREIRAQDKFRAVAVREEKQQQQQQQQKLDKELKGRG